MYNEKLDLRSHISHHTQMIALWNYLDGLMCRVFLSSLSDLGLKWFKKLPLRSIRSFIQFSKSFVARFVINTRALKGVTSLLTLCKGINEMLHNYKKQN